ncbi:MAG: ABC transporter permease [Desulfarculaceae bacterium]|nr:ABC transporter permease [Desulfarculaceae bacterium]
MRHVRAGDVVHGRWPNTMVASLWRNQALLRVLTGRELRARYTGSVLGLMWMILLPLVQLSVYTFVFAYIFRVGVDPLRVGGSGFLGFASVMFCGYVPFVLISETMSIAPGRIVGQPNFVKKVLFPLEILPVSSVLVAFLHALAAMCVLFVVLLLTGDGLTWTAFWLPVLFIPPLLGALGIGWLLSSVGVFARDIGTAIQAIIQILFFATPIAYSIRSMPPSYVPLMRLNPLTGVVENFRLVILYDKAPLWIDFAYPALFALVLMLAGFYFFQRSRKAFADVL